MRIAEITQTKSMMINDQLGESKMLYKVYDIDSDVYLKSWYDQEMPKSHTADKPMAP